jgi:hypothetical protein
LVLQELILFVQLLQFRLDRVACGALSDVEQLGSWAPPRHTENTGAGGGISPVGGADRIVEPAMLREHDTIAICCAVESSLSGWWHKRNNLRCCRRCRSCGRIGQYLLLVIEHHVDERMGMRSMLRICRLTP